MRYLIIIEKGKTSYGAYAPDLPGCGVVGQTEEAVRLLIQEAIVFHLEGLREDGEPIPEPTTLTDYIDIAA